MKAAYFDGKTSRRHVVELRLHGGELLLSGDIRRSCLIADVQVPERVRGASRKLVLPDGASLEVESAADYEVLLTELGHREPLAVRMQASWLNVLVACVVLLAILVPGYLHGLPFASKVVARRLPESAQRAIGKESLAFLDRRMLAPSALPTERQRAIIERFQSLSLPSKAMPTYEILFRRSHIGPNAFALPSGQIVMTDEMVNLLADDDAVMGVLAHELGHLHERHLLRRIIQGSAVALVSTVLLGDVSSAVAMVPTTLLDLKYSRDAEREADDYAIAMMKVNGIGLDGLMRTFQKLDKETVRLNVYLSSHPPAQERLDRIKKAK